MKHLGGINTILVKSAGSKTEQEPAGFKHTLSEEGDWSFLELQTAGCLACSQAEFRIYFPPPLIKFSTPVLLFF